MTDKKNKEASLPEKPVYPGGVEGLKSRIKDNKPSRWVRFAIVALIFTAWVAWLGNWWFLLGLVLLFDIYITGYIPFSWWRYSKDKGVRTVMSWVDAIVYALVLVYFIFAFLGQNYMIPSSSLEKTLLTGDYLVVNKVTYGPRVPMTPAHIPLVHNKLPILGCDSYLDWPQNGYRRLKGLRSVETGDIVVFNFPAGDTVATKYEETANYYDLVDAYGWSRVNNDPAAFGEIKYRPVDRRTNYVKRAVGLPGQTICIAADTIYIDGEALEYPEHVQFRYFLGTDRPLTQEMARDLGITPEDIWNVNELDKAQLVRAHGFSDGQYIVNVPLTAQMIATLQEQGIAKVVLKCNDVCTTAVGQMFPKAISGDWSVSDWGGDEGVLIPKKGLTVDLDERNWALYERAIRNYEGHHEAHWRDGKVYFGDTPRDTYTFAMDYYFMMGDNRDNSLDSRFWGFVPEDHIVGTPLFIVASFDKDRSIFNGGIRWNRIFRDANPDK